MKIVVDMNLSPGWVEALGRPGWSIRHWSSIGATTAKDAEILAWARENQSIVLTQDLDFVKLMHFTLAAGPSVVLLRFVNEHDARLHLQVGRVLTNHAPALRRGAILVFDERRARVRELPLLAARKRSR